MLSIVSADDRSAYAAQVLETLVSAPRDENGMSKWRELAAERAECSWHSSGYGRRCLRITAPVPDPPGVNSGRAANWHL